MLRNNKRDEQSSRVLVLLATYNGRRWIERQLSTVLDQQGVIVQVDVRDDNSSDGTRELVAQLAQRDSRVRLRSYHEAMRSAAANFFELILGAEVAGFDQVAFCDQDDEWDRFKLVRAAAFMRSRQADGYSATVEAYWPNGRSKKLPQSAQIRLADYLFEGGGQGCTFMMSAELFRRIQSILRENRALLAQLHYHDWAVFALTRSLGYTWAFDDQVMMRYRQHTYNDTGARSSGLGVLRRISLIRSGWYRRQVISITSLILATNPFDGYAAQWRVLCELEQRDFRGRLRRMLFVAKHGRRRVLDRCVLVVAVLCGYL